MYRLAASARPREGPVRTWVIHTPRLVEDPPGIPRSGRVDGGPG